jgi:hypothetical protein
MAYQELPLSVLRLPERIRDNFANPQIRQGVRDRCNRDSRNKSVTELLRDRMTVPLRASSI